VSTNNNNNNHYHNKNKSLYRSVNEDGILDITNIQPNMSGVYVCDAENAAGITQKIFYLIVHGK
jgi:hypothetical protein